MRYLDERTPISYHGVHLRLRAKRGRAAEQTCRHCGQQAHEWSYDGTDPAELVGPYSSSGAIAAYSLDLDRYVPLCRSCHRARDPHRNRGKTHCKHGHEFTAENTYAWRGRRFCRACKLIRQNQWRANRRDAA